MRVSLLRVFSQHRLYWTALVVRLNTCDIRLMVAVISLLSSHVSVAVSWKSDQDSRGAETAITSVDADRISSNWIIRIRTAYRTSDM